jgi:hypothetical protein
MMGFPESPRPRSFGWIISIVSSITHPSLETVTITIFDVQEEIDAHELSTLYSLFMTQPLSNNSTKLRFFIRGGVREEGVCAALRDGLPKLDGKKRLEFDV